jgi:alpha-glucuronidase
VIDGSLHNYKMSGMAGVANIGTDRNWCGHPFGQANWYVFGRLAWDPALSAEEIAEEWIRMTFTNNE